ncbi:MAG: hypothetical protein LBO74_08720 [Candidatus Symbiothrix sp.]|jgi:hypothetical protein|nr:hypothetical protein [Candidatus Symbiothrix sp.]
MNKISLSGTEKRILKELSISQYEDGMFDDLSRAELYVASNRLKGYGLIIAHYAEGNELVVAHISDEGQVYLKENPLLENPVSDNELKRLQIDELEYKKRIRKMEDVIRVWKLVSAIIGLIGVVGWLFFFLKNG